MSPTFLLYGANGYVGNAIARLAVQLGLSPILAGRSEERIKPLATELGLEYRVFSLDNTLALDQALKEAKLVLHCAGPYVHTSKPMVAACLRTGVHYLDITGEIPVYEFIAANQDAAKARGVMLLPGVGFDVVPTDCLALHLQKRLPTANRLALAFQSVGPAGLPPGTQRTMIELLPFGNLVRKNGALVRPDKAVETRSIDFGKGPVTAIRLTWGDVFTAYHSTGIPNISDYAVLPDSVGRQMAVLDLLRPVFKIPFLRKFMQRSVKPGPSAEKRAQTVVHVWGEVEDDQGNKATARLKGPEAGLIWTSRAALAAVKKVLAGHAPPGYQTPGMAFGPDFVLECEGVTREDVWST